jgi:carbohydrate kinase (thermoresistant glucokinase family)
MTHDRGTVTKHIVVMGVSGTGKSAVGRPLAAALGFAFADGDDFHGEANIAKMTAGHALTDVDRLPWLERMGAWMTAQRTEGRSTVLACSALRRSYRDVLRAAVPDTYFAHLIGTEELIRSRMESRKHFMPASLLRDQEQTLEPLEPNEIGTTFDVTQDVDEVVQQIIDALHHR